MSEAALPVPIGQEVPIKVKKGSSSTLIRVGRYMLVRLVTLFLTVIVGVYLTIMIANMGGYVDKIRRGDIEYNAAVSVNNNPATSSSFRQIEPS